MNALIYHLVVPLLFLLSKLPFALLYLISDGVYVLIYYILRYRRKVVRKNLVNSFPDKSLPDIIKIEKAFYRFFCDFILESIKYFSMSQAEFLERCKFEETQELEKLFKEKKSFVAVLGHYGNWEWAAPVFSLKQLHQLFVIYKPLSNLKFDEWMRDTRSRFGTKLIAMQNVVREMIRNRSTTNATIFVSDQTPFPEDAVWTTFLHQDTAVFRGAEVMSKKMNLPVVFVSVRRERRGYYNVHVEMLCENPQETADGEISKLHTAKLEKEILLQPEIWLWSHKRWKYKRPESV